MKEGGRVPAWADLAVLALAFSLLTAWSWGTWPDVLIDFGRELYVAWRLSEGDVLYRDVASFYGPLSPYVNAGWFRLFGVGLTTLACANLALLALATVLLRALLRRAGASRWAALSGGLVFLCLFGFGHLIANGNFNFVCPYAHEATHGFLLAVAALSCAVHLLLRPAGRADTWAAVSGLLCGLAFLTKPEGFVAGAGASLVALLLSGRGQTARRRARASAAFVLGVLVPPLLAFALLARAMPADEAWRGTLGSWAYLGNGDLLQLRYFAWSMGLDHPVEHAAQLAGAVGRQLGLLLPAAALAWALRGNERLARWAPLLAGLATLALLAPSWRARWWFGAARTLPLWTLGILAAAAVAAWRHRDDDSYRPAAARVALATLALLLLPRIALHARVFHYGFVLAGPATLLVVAALLDWIPRRLDAAGAPGRVFAAVGAGALAVALAFHLSESQSRMATLKVEVGGGRDRFRADQRGHYVNAVLAAFPRVPQVGRTLAVLPEGVMINYLLRRPSSVPYLTMLPSDDAQFGEDELLGSLQRQPPDLLALVHRTTEEFGTPYFGTDYARRTMEWIRAGYGPVFTIGDPPLKPGSTFGIALLRRTVKESAR